MRNGRRTAAWIWMVVPLLVAAACSSPEPAESQPGIPPQLAEHPAEVVDIDNRPYFVAVADTRQLRATGLMHVADLGRLDGMLFVFDELTDADFHMKDTLIPLDIAFFDDLGGLVSVEQMVPCEDSPCPSYFAAGPFRYAVEARAGTFSDLPDDAILDPG
ncbi:MAG: DUF192 domain-containing protein [Acidimicrobiia bacterium]